MAIGTFALPVAPPEPTEWTQEYYEGTRDDYVRDSALISMPDLGENENKVTAIIAVMPDDRTIVAFVVTTSTGQYRVDWGDGTFNLYNSGALAEKTFIFNDYSALTLHPLGYRQGLVTVTTVSGNIITAEFNRRPSSYPSGLTAVGYWLEVFSSSASLNAFPFSAPTPQSNNNYLMRYGHFGTGGASFGMGSMFTNCVSLRAVYPLPNIGTTQSTSNCFSGCFQLVHIAPINTFGVFPGNTFSSCRKLRAIKGPTDLGNATLSTFMLGCSSIMFLQDMTTGTNIATSAFNGCISLKKIKITFTSPNVNCSSTFNGCTLLENIDLVIPSVINSNSMFSGCGKLKSVPLFNTNNSTNIASMFNTCTSLKIIPAFNFSSATDINSLCLNCSSLEIFEPILFNSATIATSMLSGCNSLINIGTLIVPLVNSQASMFLSCASLREIPAINFAAHNSATIYTNFLINCPNLTAFKALNISNNLLILSRIPTAGLVEVFNNLPTVTAKTITITNCLGAAGLTSANRLIATNKGWTVTG